MDATERVRGWRDIMAEHGLVARPPLEGDWSPRSGYQNGGFVLDQGQPFSAIFCSNDQMALGFLHALRDRSLRVPENISMIGFDDIPEAEHFDPPLTTMRQDFHELGQDIMIAVQAALDRSEATRTIRHLPTLVFRQSTRQFES